MAGRAAAQSKVYGPKVYRGPPDLSASDLILPVRRESMKRELGFESGSDEDLELDDDDDYDRKHSKTNGSHANGDMVPRSKIAELQEELEEESHRRLEILEQLKAAEEKVSKYAEDSATLKNMTKSQIAILKRQYEDQLHKKDAAFGQLKNAVDALQTDPSCKSTLEGILATVDELHSAPPPPDSNPLIQELQQRNDELKKKIEDLQDALASKGSNSEGTKGRSRESNGEADEELLTQVAALKKERSAWNKERDKLQRELEAAKASGGGGGGGEVSDQSRAEVEKEKKALAKEVKQLTKARDAAEAEVARLQEALKERDSRLEKQESSAEADTSAAAAATELVAAKEAQWQTEKDQLTSDLEKKMREALKQKDRETKEEKLRLKDKVEGLLKKREEETEKLRAQYEQAVSDHQALNERFSSIVEGNKGKIELLSRAKTNCKDVKKSLVAMRKDAKELFSPTMFKELSVSVKKLVEQTSDSTERYKKELKERRRLYNIIQELKGNIRVYCRARPLNSEERANGEKFCCEFPDDSEIIIEGPTGKKSFEFDRIFSPACNQEQVFEDTRPLVTSVLDGYNVCIFAYGQTGSGKTYTMEGPPSDRGVNYRALAELFRLAISENAADYDYDIRVSLLEVYNEQINDLLADPKEGRRDVRSGPSGTYIPDLTMVPVKSDEEVGKVMEMGSRNRKVGATAMNTDSSRSHLVLTVYVEGVNKATGIRSTGKLNLVDLAGSERLSKSLATGDRLKEAQSINKSLSALGNVIASLAQKNAHVPYRDSKLTMVLQDSLAGDSKTLMFVQLRPSELHVSETVCSLNFAQRVRSVELGQAKKHTSAASASDSVRRSPADDDSPTARGRPSSTTSSKSAGGSTKR
eukprot:CAMPEP_0184658688 /NCGR_PEP_ID=MMETSP0308-20130426/26510_1 /TAXON_ID=38269 /ORGANISM="Gloeochaete witrockiana, Strain SAG 46.84" /LENGTH=870 /DNA_ID=CAMNT_0027097865 /DNA_START=48 /DNA_END=2660 /DNA_ORIENTATION=+